MLELRNVTKYYSGIPAVENVSFIAKAGEVTGYLGPNGSGKSTTLKMITGLIDPSEGQILYRGEPIQRDRIGYKQRLGYVPEEPHLYPHLAGAEYLEMVGQLRGLPERRCREKIDGFLRLLGLHESRYVAISSYSKGMRQKILLAAALLHNPELVLLDEPFSGLDVNSGLILRNLIRDLAARGKVVLFSSHELETVERVSAHIVILHKGHVVANNSIEELRTLMSLPNLEAIFSELAVEQDTDDVTRKMVALIVLNMPDERRQFRILYRDFLLRMVDLEVLTRHGDIQNLLGQLVALLAAFSFTFTLVCVPRYVESTLPWEKLMTAAWGDEEFLISLTVAIVGFFAVLAWNAVLPDRRDCLVLGPLPVRVRTMFLARISAMATALAVSVAALNIFTGLTFAFLLNRPDGNPLRSFAAYWITMFAAGLFIFCALLAVQGVVAQLLPYRLFLRVTSFLQLASFFAILIGFFLTPPLATLRGLTNPSIQTLIAISPPFWFLGLFQELNGPMDAVFGPLAQTALRNLLIVFSISAVAYSLAYIRQSRKIVEMPDIAPGSRGSGLRLGSALVNRIFPAPLDRAIVLFVARTVARSRQHRFLLAAYGGTGLAIALAYAKSLIFGYRGDAWFELNQPLLTGTLVITIFAIVGARAIFSLPIALPANWIFRMTISRPSPDYFAAVRKALYILAAVPAVVVCSTILVVIWPLSPALEHVAVLALVGILVVEVTLYLFQKIPFACSYLPGNSHINVKFGIYAVIFLVSAEVGTQLEFWALHRTGRFAILIAVLYAFAQAARYRTVRAAAAPGQAIQFEERPPDELFALDLHTDGAWSGEATGG